MKLNEKIHFYRTRAKLSQEELAAQVGVSRQAVSKWELGEATPEVSKLAALAKAFGVTTDELLSEEAPQREPEEEAPAPPSENPVGPDARPSGGAGLLDHLVRRYGWLAGVYLALGGLGTALVGGLARFAFGQMFATADGWFGSAPGWSYSGPAGYEDAALAALGIQPAASPLGGMQSVFLTISTVILVVGVLAAAAGAILAVKLYRKGNSN